MGSSIFERFGLGGIDLGLVIVALGFVVFILMIMIFVQMSKSKKLLNRYNKFMQGTRAKNLEEQIQDLIATVDSHDKLLKSHSKDISDLFTKHESTYQKMGLTKYDAFKEMGGKLSCCLCMLDENDNGFIMNNVHSSTGCYSYTKRIRHGKCDLDLSQEEKDTLEKAMNDGNK